MIQRRLRINADDGLQSRAAALLVQVAGKFSSSVWLEQGNKRVNAKSIMGILSLRLKRGDSLLLVASGEDEEAAAKAITELIEKGETAL